MTEQNSIIIERRIDGYDICALATYDEAAGGWTCRVREGPFGALVETRGPDETGNDVFSTLVDMIDLAFVGVHERDRLAAGPFSDEQCGAKGKAA